MLLRFVFVLSQPVPIDRLGALSGKLDFLRAAVTSQPIHEFRRGGVWREVSDCPTCPSRGYCCPRRIRQLGTSFGRKSRAMPLRDAPFHARANSRGGVRTKTLFFSEHQPRSSKSLGAMPVPAQEFLHLVAWDLSRLIEETKELARVRLSVRRRRFRPACRARVVIEQLVDAYQRLADGEMRGPVR